MYSTQTQASAPHRTRATPRHAALRGAPTSRARETRGQSPEPIAWPRRCLTRGPRPRTVSGAWSFCRRGCERGCCSWCGGQASVEGEAEVVRHGARAREMCCTSRPDGARRRALRRSPRLQRSPRSGSSYAALAKYGRPLTTSGRFARRRRAHGQVTRV